jgi:protein-S-isoprenylcysteine O-methyltransferase Ste14
VDAPQTPVGMPSPTVGKPRWLLLILVLCIFLIVYPLVHGVLPWLLSQLTPRYGWMEDRPVLGNLLGLLPALGGAAGLLWVLVTGLQHWDRVPQRMKLGLTPPYLLTHGPYAVTRHPIYVACLALWLGWTLFYGSVAVFVGFVVLAVVVRFIVPREERALEAHFGEEYRQYKAAVPRWLALPWR